MTWVDAGRRVCLLGWALCAALPVHAADQSTQEPWHRQLAQARQSYYAGLEGDHGADAQAHQLFSRLLREHPKDSTLQAYCGSLELLDAARTWALWRKHSLSADGMAQMDAAVNTNPGDLEARFVRALTTWHLPFFFHRKQQAEDDLLYLGPRAEAAARSGALPPPLAAAALDYWGQVLDDRKEPEKARQAYGAAARVDGGSPGGKDAARRLR